MCIFCQLFSHKDQYIYENDYVFAIYDNYPVTKGHTLIIPKRHFETIFTASDEEIMAIGTALKVLKNQLDLQFHPDGYNVGINNGIDAGQSVMHLHVHLIPRYHGDSNHPRGGIRGVIPGKQEY
ncbi:MAG: HIT family protein [Candidatus Izemoplasmatales bacterium]|jgi:diadenosine tetraphosphate (Ap4A) HIT family hydrolase